MTGTLVHSETFWALDCVGPRDHDAGNGPQTDKPSASRRPAPRPAPLMDGNSGVEPALSAAHSGRHRQVVVPHPQAEHWRQARPQPDLPHFRQGTGCLTLGPMVSSLPSACQALLDTQRGVLARWQAADALLSPAVMDTQLRRGRWQSLYRGVYATFTGPPPRLSVLWAAALRAGSSAVLSHHSAAELDHLTDRPAATIHVTTVSERRITISAGEGDVHMPTVVVHYSSHLSRARHPTRTPPRTRIEETTLDLAQTADNLEDAWSWLTCACARRLTTPGRLREAMESRPKMRWRADLALGLAETGDGIHSLLERHYVHRVERRHGLPTADRQSLSKVGMRTRYLDNHYKEFGVAVELDGRVAHPAEARWRDVRRDNSSVRLGIVTLRYAWPDITVRPCLVAVEVAAVLQNRGWKDSLRPCGPSCPVGDS